MPALTTGAVALAPVVPITLTAQTRGTSTPPSYRPAPDRSGLWLRNAAAGLCVLAAAAAAVSFTAFGGLRYQKCLNASEGRVGRGLAEAWVVGCGG